MLECVCVCRVSYRILGLGGGNSKIQCGGGVYRMTTRGVWERIPPEL